MLIYFARTTAARRDDGHKAFFFSFRVNIDNVDEQAYGVVARNYGRIYIQLCIENSQKIKNKNKSINQ